MANYPLPYAPSQVTMPITKETTPAMVRQTIPDHGGNDTLTRIEALEFANRLGHNTPEQIIKSARMFYRFLTNTETDAPTGDA